MMYFQSYILYQKGEFEEIQHSAVMPNCEGQIGATDKQGGGNPIAQHKDKLSDQGAQSGVSSTTN